VNARHVNTSMYFSAIRILLHHVCLADDVTPLEIFCGKVLRSSGASGKQPKRVQSCKSTGLPILFAESWLRVFRRGEDLIVSLRLAAVHTAIGVVRNSKIPARPLVGEVGGRNGPPSVLG